jgi:hypothetical protein
MPRSGDERWVYLNGVIVTAGAPQPRLKPGIAIAVRRDGPSAPSARHPEGIVHGDVEPSNILLTRTGNAKPIDIETAFAREDAPRHAGRRRAQRPEGVGGLGTIEGTMGRRPSRSCIPWGNSPLTPTHRSDVGRSRKNCGRRSDNSVVTSTHPGQRQRGRRRTYAIERRTLV